MKNILKIKIDLSTYIFLFLIILTGMFKQFSFLFILLFFHELGHALAGIVLGWDLKSITFYPYGGVTLFSKFENSSINKEIIILLMGPIFQIITYYILINIFKYNYISNYHYSLLIFNLLPILSLDGGKLLNLLLNKIFNYLTSFYISVFISFITIIFLIIFCLIYYYNFNLFLISIFLIFKIIKSLKEIKYYYHKFILERYLYKINYRKHNLSKDIYSFYKERNHYIDFQEESNYLKKYFQK